MIFSYLEERLNVVKILSVRPYCKTIFFVVLVKYLTLIDCTRRKQHSMYCRPETVDIMFDTFC